MVPTGLGLGGLFHDARHDVEIFLQLALGFGIEIAGADNQGLAGGVGGAGLAEHGMESGAGGNSVTLLLVGDVPELLDLAFFDLALGTGLLCGLKLNGDFLVVGRGSRWGSACVLGPRGGGTQQGRQSRQDGEMESEFHHCSFSV